MEPDTAQGSFWETVDKVNQGTNAALVALSAVVLIAMAFMVTYDVLVRNIFNTPLPASVEISQLMAPYVVFLPFAYTLTVGAHVQVTLLTMRLPGLFSWALKCWSTFWIFYFSPCSPTSPIENSCRLGPAAKLCWPQSSFPGGSENSPCPWECFLWPYSAYCS